MSFFKSNLLIPVSCLILISGCSYMQSEPQWERTSVTHNHNQEHAMAKSTCLAEAYKAVPNLPTAQCGNDTGFAQGFCQGSNNKQRREMTQIREDIYEGCMINKGWQKSSTN